MERREMLKTAERIAHEALQCASSLGSGRFEKLQALKNDDVATQTLAQELLEAAVDELEI